MVVGRLKPGLTIGAARSDMTALSKRLRAVFGTDTQAADADLTPLRDYLVADYRVMLTIVFGAAALVLLIACTNLVSAQLARGRGREREIVVRAALGASRARLVRQLLFESGVLVVGGTVLGIAFAIAATTFVRAVGANLVPRLVELKLDGQVLAFVALVATATALLVGVYPALRLASRDASLVLRARTAGMNIRRSVWRVLIGFEIALAVVLLIGSALLIRTLHNILTADTGFDARGVVTMAISSSDEDAPRLLQALDDIRGLPGVEGAAFTNHLPLQWGNGSAPLRRPGDPLDRDWPAMAGFRVVGTDYFAVLRQPVLEGRAFTPADRDGAAEVAIITPGVAAKLWPGQNPIGQLIATNYLFKDWLTVVGVVAEASSWSQPRGTQNEIYVPLAQHPKSVEGQLIAMIRTAGSPGAAIPMLRGRLQQLLPTSPAEIGTLEERIARSASDRRFAMLALSAFGAIALLLAAIGIYGVIWYIVTTRTHEIGIRMALGATAGRVRTEVLSGAVAMAAGGIIAGIAGGAFATRYLQATLYGVSRLDPRTYLLGALVALATAMLAAYVPARRSSRVDPMVAMRGE
jgi:predicted permease